MEKTRKWRKILAMMLTVVMMLQNAQSVMVFADVTNEQIEQRLAGNQGQTEETQPAQSQVDTRANGEEYKTQSQETQENGNGSTDIGSPESGNATTEAKTSNADVSATITQSVFQADVSGTTCNFVQMTAQITNNDAENPATGVSVKALLNSAQLNYVNGYGTETTGAGAYVVDSNNTADLPSGSADGYNQIVMWTDQTIGAGETVAYQFAAQIIPENLDGVVNAWYVDGTSCSYTWENTEILVPTQAPVESTPEVAPPQTEPEEKLEVKPEVKPEETIPEVTEAPEVTPTPEVTEVPEATPTPEPTQAAEDKKAIVAKKKEQKRLLNQKSRVKAFKADAEDTTDGVDDVNAINAGDAQTIADPNNENTYDAGSLSEFITNFDIYTKDENGELTSKYDPKTSKPLEKGGSFKMKVYFSEVEEGRQFKVPNPDDEKLLYAKVTYKIDNNIITGFNSETGNIELEDKDQKKDFGNGGRYEIGSDGTVTFYLRKDYIAYYYNCKGAFEFSGHFSKDIDTSTSTEHDIAIGNVTKTVTFDNSSFSVNKSVTDYKPETNSFHFVIKLLVYGQQIHNVTITDTMQENLVLPDNATINITPSNSGLTVENKSNNGFTLAANSLSGSGDEKSYKEYTIEYDAKIKEGVISKDNEVVLSNAKNTVNVTDSTNKTATDSVSPSYRHVWLQKSQKGELDTTTGKVKWTLRVNEDGSQNANGWKVTDQLKSDYLQYDTSDEGIVCKRYQLTNGVRQYVDKRTIPWNDNVLSQDNQSWSYEITDQDAYYEYEFSYYTLVDNVGGNNQNLENSAKVEKGSSSFTDSGSYTGTGTGTGTGHVKKSYEGTTEDEKYFKWKSEITVPQGGLTGVVLYDELLGDGTVDIANLNVQVDPSDIKVKPVAVNGSDKAFNLYFVGDDVKENEYAEKSSLPDKGKEYKVTITYQTPKRDGNTVNIGNTVTLTGNKKTEMSVVPKKELKSYVFTKNGTRSGNQITWKIGLDLGHMGLSGKLTVEDTLSDGQELLDSPAPVIVNPDGSVCTDAEVISTKREENKTTFTIYIPNNKQLASGEYYSLQYVTKIDPNKKSFSNNAQIKKGTEVLGKVDKTLSTAYSPITKEEIDLPTNGNKYVGEYEIVVSGDAFDIDENYSGEYVITDKPSGNMVIQTNTLKVICVDNNQEITNYGWTENNGVLTISIPNAGKKTYKITYKAAILPTDDWDEKNKPTVGYTNSATIKIDKQTEDVKKTWSVIMTSKGSSSMSGSVKYINIYKQQENNQSQTIKGAQFKVYLVDGENELLRAEGETGDKGLIFGQLERGQTPAAGMNLVGLKKLGAGEDGQDTGFVSKKTYRLYETKAADGYAQIDSPVLIKEFTVGASADATGSGILDPESVVFNYINVTNKKVTNIAVNKEWDDENNQDGKRPTKVEVKLQWKTVGDSTYKDFSDEDTWCNSEPQSFSKKVLEENNSWKASWSELPQYKKNSNSTGAYDEVQYQVVETKVKYPDSSDWEEIGTTQISDKYWISSSVDSKNGNTTTWTITNKYVPGKVSYAVEKVWDDDSNRDGKRPTKVVMKLKGTYKDSNDQPHIGYESEIDITATANNEEKTNKNKWKYTWTNLPEKVQNGGTSYTLTYTIEETKVFYQNVGEMSVIKDPTKVNDSNPYYVTTDKNGTTWTFTNHYTPETTTVSVNKTWNTKGDTNAVIPSSVKFTLKAKQGNANGNEISGDEFNELLSGSMPNRADQTVKKPNDARTSWTCQWTGLKKYYKGTTVYYYIEESAADDSIENSLEHWNLESSYNTESNTWTLINTYTNNISVEATKVWDDEDNKDKTRPDKITFTLYWPKLENGDFVKYTEGNALQTNEKVYEYNGQKYVYIPYERDAQKDLNGNSTNTWGRVTWKDLPSKWLYVNGANTEIANTEIDYQVFENEVAGYTPTITKENNVFTITNKHIPEEGFTATKIWDDDSNRYGLRPSSVTFQLYCREKGSKEDGTKVETDGNGKSGNITVDAKDNWTVTWSKLPTKNESGKELEYHVKEVETQEALGNYKASYSEVINGTQKVTNKLKLETTTKSVQKYWDDENNIDGTRPDSITLKLTAKYKGTTNAAAVLFYDETTNTFKAGVSSINIGGNSEATSQLSDTVVLHKNADGTWPTYTWKKLPKYGVYGGKQYEIEYHIEELNIPTDYTFSEDTTNSDIVINKKDTEEREITVVKTWDDNNDSEGVRPESIKLQLKADGENFYTRYEKHLVNDVWDGTWTAKNVTIDPVDVKAAEDGTWTATWKNLPKHRIDSATHKSVEIKYTVEETLTGKDAKNYSVKYVHDDTNPDQVNSNVFTITNHHDTEKISKELVKVWQDTDSDITRPKTASFGLYMSVYGKLDDKGTMGYTDMLRVDSAEFNKFDTLNGNTLLKEFVVNGKSVLSEAVKTVNVPAKNNKNNTNTCSWSNLLKNFGGKEIKYEIREENKEAIKNAGYQISAENYSDHTTIYNTTSKVTVSKKDISGKEELAGARLQIIDPEVKGEESVKDDWVSDGTEHIVTNLVIGHEYILHEVSAPDGYLTTDDVTFTVGQDGSATSVEMKDKPTEVSVLKTGEDGKGLAGAVFKVTDKDGKVVTYKDASGKDVEVTWISDVAKHEISAVLKVGVEYKLVEVSAPSGYQPKDSITFKIDKTGKVYINDSKTPVEDNTIVIKNSKNTIEFAKVEAGTTNTYVVGAELEVHRETANGQLAVDKNGNVLKWTSENKVKTVNGLEAGTYYLVETKAPQGYKIADPVKFVVDGNKTDSVYVKMEDAKTSVLIKKVDADGKDLANAELEIHDATGNKVPGCSWTTDGKAHDVSGKLVDGQTYTLVETKAPAGYRIADPVTFKMDSSKDVITVTMKDTPTKASILKTDESGKALSGATLVVKDSTGKEIDKWTTDGKAHEITGRLTVGETYTLSELSAPSGYTVAPDQTFKMEDKDVIEVTMVDYQASGSGKVTVTKRVTLANGGDLLDLIAQDDTFYVNLFTDAAGKYPYKGAAPKAIHLVNASAGSVTFSDLAQGTYYVYETDASGNVINLDQQSVHNGTQFMCTVDGGSNTVKLDLKAGPKEGVVNLENVFYDIPTGYSYKAEININKQVLKGTSQTTVDDTFYAGIFTKDDQGVYNLFTVVTLVQNDTVTVEVPLGGEDGTEPINYYILETDADGNILDLDVFEYEVTGEGTVALSKDNLAGNINLVNKIPEDTDGKLRVQKTDGNGVGLAGASFRLTDEDGSVIDEWTSEASAHELELEPGTYTLTEVQAPTGYTGAGSVTIKVDDDYNFSVSGEIDYSYKGGLLKIVNKATPSTPSSGTPASGGSTPASYSSALSGKVAVKTGDNTPIGAYAAVLVIAALAIAGGIFYKKKRKNDK